MVIYTDEIWAENACEEELWHVAAAPFFAL